ncbi:MAG: hypothetical protein ACRC6G_05615 [Deefgea sp.]
MKKIKLSVVCTDVDHTEGGVYIASFVPAPENEGSDVLKDGFRLQSVIIEDDAEGTEAEGAEAEVFKIGERYDVFISELKKELSEAEAAEAKAKKAEADKAYKAKKKAEAEAEAEAASK